MNEQTENPALQCAIELVQVGPIRTVEWLEKAYPMCAYCKDGEDVSQAAARIILEALIAERSKNNCEKSSAGFHVKRKEFPHFFAGLHGDSITKWSNQPDAKNVRKHKRSKLASIPS